MRSPVIREPETTGKRLEPRITSAARVLALLELCLGLWAIGGSWLVAHDYRIRPDL